MYLKKEILKKIKELVFKNKLQNKLCAFVNDISEEKIKANLNLLGEMNTNYSDELYFLHIDLLNSFHKNSRYFSNHANEILNKITDAETRVKNSLENVSDNTKLLMKILKEEFNEDSYVVGGFVRDSIANKKPKDIDFCTNIPYNRLQEVFERNGFKTKDSGKQFLVLNVTKK